MAEEEHEQGVAHIVEHLAFNATEKYSNHAIVKFLEAVGAEFGACQVRTGYLNNTLLDNAKVHVSHVSCAATSNT